MKVWIIAACMLLCGIAVLYCTGGAYEAGSIGVKEGIIGGCIGAMLCLPFTCLLGR